MARLVGLVLLVVGVYLGVSIYTNGAEQTLARATGAEDVAPASEAAAPAPRAERRPVGGAAPSAITSRVRDRVNGAIAEGVRRQAGE